MFPLRRWGCWQFARIPAIFAKNKIKVLFLLKYRQIVLDHEVFSHIMKMFYFQYGIVILPYGLWQYVLSRFQGRDTKFQYCILKIGIALSCQKLGIILENKVFEIS